MSDEAPDRPDVATLFDRRQFTNATLLALLSGVTVTIVGCGSSDDSPTAPSGGGGSGSRTGSVSANHGHNAVITSAQLTAGQGVTLDIRGTADHPHTVVLTMAEVGQVAGGQRVSKVSSSDPSASFGLHGHTVIFN